MDYSRSVYDVGIVFDIDDLIRIVDLGINDAVRIAQYDFHVLNASGTGDSIGLERYLSDHRIANHLREIYKEAGTIGNKSRWYSTRAIGKAMPWLCVLQVVSRRRRPNSGVFECEAGLMPRTAAESLRFGRTLLANSGPFEIQLIQPRGFSHVDID